jgi:hypothetical protein
VVTSRKPLEFLGWKILEKDIPFDLSEIENQNYANEVALRGLGTLLARFTAAPLACGFQVKSNGCCGHLELLKLHAWAMTDYHRVVHLDMDSFVLV